MNKIKKLAEILSQSNRAVFFGGAGMSTESGIPDFRQCKWNLQSATAQEFSP